MADPAGLSRGQMARLFLSSTLLLAGFGAVATVASPAERADGTVAAASAGAERVTEDATPSSTTTTAAPLALAAPDDAVRVDEAIVYGTAATVGGPVELLLDLYVPLDPDGTESVEGQPGAILLHGGGFTGGSRANDGIPELATALAEHGIVTAAIDYRLVGDDPVVTTPELVGYFDGLDPATVDDWLADTTVVSAAIEDTLLAAEWLLDQGIDPDRLVVGGSSAGAATALYAAHLGDDAALDSPDFGAAISLWGGYTLTPGLAEPLDAGDAPVWAVHGTDDQIVPYEYASVVAWRAGAAGVDAVVHGIEGAGHGFASIDLWSDRTAVGEVLIDDLLAFLDRHL